MKKEAGYIVSLVGVVVDIALSLISGLAIFALGFPILGIIVVGLSSVGIVAIVNYHKREWVIVLLVLSAIGLLYGLVNGTIPLSSIVILIGTILTLSKKDN